MKLREYQQALADQAFADSRKGLSPCIVSATGSGKTIVAAELVRKSLELGEPCLLVAHRMAIVKQLFRSIKDHCGMTPQLITRDHTTPLAQVTVAMVQTLSRRESWIERLRDRNYIVDECHHVSPSYQVLKQKLRPRTTVGLTATPIRPNGGTILGPDSFTHLIQGPPPRWLIDNGFICDYDLYGSKHEIDTSGLKRQQNGEFSEKEHEERVLKISGSVVPDYLEFNPTREKTIAIGVTVEHAEQLVSLYREAGINARLIVGKIREKERDRIFHEFKHGNIEVLVSVALIDEGLDIPAATCIQLVRNIGSVRLQRQLIGRVLRKSADPRKRAIVIDHGGSWRNPKIGFPCEDYYWPTQPKEKGEVKRKQGAFIEPQPNGRMIVVNMVQTGSKMQLITPTNSSRQPSNSLAGMTAKERAEFFRRQNPVEAAAKRYEQGVIPELVKVVSQGRPGAVGRSLARPGRSEGRARVGRGGSRRPR
jgi:superfamily II DNA or RNA helicase